MAIIAIAGAPKSGKTYEAVKYHINPAIKAGRKVVTNVVLSKDYYQMVFGEKADLIEIIEFNYHDYGAQRPFSNADWFTQFDHVDDEGRGPLFVIDECHLAFPKNNYPQTLQEYFTLHGHWVHDIVLMTQSSRFFHPDLKPLIEVTFGCTKLSSKGVSNRYIRKIYQGTTRTSTYSEECEYDESIFPFYKAYTKRKGKANAVFTSALLKNMDKLKNLRRFLYILMFTLIAYTVWGFVFSSDVEADAKKDSHVVTTENGEKVQIIQAPPKNEKIKQVIIQQSDDFHPYYKVDLHIDGVFSDIYKGRRVKTFSILATKGMREVFRMSADDLIMAGYDVRVVGDCSILIKYFEYQDYITCDAPEQKRNSIKSDNVLKDSLAKN